MAKQSAYIVALYASTLPGRARWQLRARNGRILAHSGTLYATRAACNRAARRLADALGAEVQVAK